MSDQGKKVFVTAGLCLSEILSMSGTMFFPTLLPHFQKIWGLSHSEAGFINGIFYAGYALAAPVLVSLTDRRGARRIYLFSAGVGVLSMLRSISFFMVLSGALGCLVGFTAYGPLSMTVLWCFIYGIAIMMDSGSLTAGVVSTAAAGESGVTLAVYSFAGFAMAFLAPLAFGVILDLIGAGIPGWGTAFAILGIANLTGPFWRKVLNRREA